MSNVERIVEKKISGVDESFNNLNLLPMEKGSEEYEALIDGLEIGEMKVNLFWKNFLNGGSLIPEISNMEMTIIEEKRQNKMDKHINNPVYRHNFETLCGWFDKGAFEDVSTVGAKVRYVKKLV